MSNLYIVATPIGNLEDITLRAIRVLGEVDLVLCEDTRVTKKLLNHYDISTKTESYHAHSNASKEEKILTLLREGKDLALVTDSGTPTISDPGSYLVSMVRKELPDVEIIAIPGASAVTAALSISGFLSSEFLFLGFLPHKKGRMTRFEEIKNSKQTVVFYESPHRLLKTLKSLDEYIPEDRKIAVVKEITKIYEKVVSGSAGEVLDFFENTKDMTKGEFVLIIQGMS